MYDKEMIARAILSPFTSNLTNEIARQETIDGYKHGVRSIIVAPGQVDMILDIKRQYANGYTRAGMIVGYPFGGLSKTYKEYLTKYAVEKGLEEIDVGVNITAIKSGDFETAREELVSLLKIAGGRLNIVPLVWMVRIPFELVDKICQMYIDIGIKSIKTSPGIHFGDMKVEHISYLASHFGDKLNIEVAGRVRSREKAEEMTILGASYFHISQWRRIGGIGQDIQFNFDTKKAEFGEYRDRL
jgi:deoxyribose-phosphate aldolase